MDRLRHSMVAILALVTFLTGSDALRTTILKPIRSTGAEEVGLIFIPGPFIKAHQYNKTARAIQEASELNVWVALPGDFFYLVVEGKQVKNAVQDAVRELQKAGMASDNYIGVGHGMAGQHLARYAENSDVLKGLILLGSTVSRATVLRDFPMPVLTIGAELDGLTKITRIVQEYEKIKTDKISFFKGIYRTPVVMIEGANHAQFASGKIPAQILSNDLKANITQDQAHSEIAKHVSDFLTVSFSSKESDVDKALSEMSETFLKTVKKLQPFLDIRNLDTDGRESMWAIVAQEIFADELDDNVAVYNAVFDNPMFFTLEPGFIKEDDDLIVGTFALVYAPPKKDTIRLKAIMESPREISMKLMSKNALWGALRGKNDTGLKSAPKTCKSLNQYALTVALAASTQESRDRYFESGRPIIFEDDAQRGANLLWSPSYFQNWEDVAGLHVKSVAMVTPRLHYCKVLPVYRAMEWVNVDSLRPFPGASKSRVRFFV